MNKDSMKRTVEPDGVPLLENLEMEHADWHHDQWPDLAPHLAWLKLEVELKEFELAVGGWRWRRSPVNLAAVLEEAADVVICVLGVLRLITGGKGFAEALAEKWARVKRRRYDGAASATRRRGDGE